eukprot:RCo019949
MTIVLKEEKRRGNELSEGSGKARESGSLSLSPSTLSRAGSALPPLPLETPMEGLGRPCSGLGGAPQLQLGGQRAKPEVDGVADWGVRRELREVDVHERQR